MLACAAGMKPAFQNQVIEKRDRELLDNKCA
jgi:hypothetical protein